MGGAGASYNQSAPTTVAQSPESAVQGVNAATTAALPNYYQTLESLMPGYTTASTNSANQAAANLVPAATQLYQQYAPLLNQTSQQLGASNLQSNAQAIGNTLSSPAAQQVNQGFAQGQGQLNPAYAATQTQLASLMANQNPNALSGSEQAQITRSLNQSNFNQGNQNVQNPLTNINNAITFGSGLQQKQANFANLASSASNTSNTLNAGQNTFGLATGQPSGTASANTSTSTGQFLPSPNTSSGIGNASAQLGTALSGQLGSTYNSANVASAGQQSSSGISANAQVCCFALILGRESIPWYVRSARDSYYMYDHFIYDGYSLFANLIGRLMFLPIIFWLTKKFIVQPLVEHAGYMVKEQGCKPRYNYAKFWIKVWSFMGKVKI